MRCAWADISISSMVQTETYCLHHLLLHCLIMGKIGPFLLLLVKVSEGTPCIPISGGIPAKLKAYHSGPACDDTFAPLSLLDSIDSFRCILIWFVVRTGMYGACLYCSSWWRLWKSLIELHVIVRGTKQLCLIPRLTVSAILVILYSTVTHWMYFSIELNVAGISLFMVFSWDCTNIRSNLVSISSLFYDLWYWLFFVRPDLEFSRTEPYLGWFQPILLIHEWNCSSYCEIWILSSSSFLLIVVLLFFSAASYRPLPDCLPSNYCWAS